MRSYYIVGGMVHGKFNIFNSVKEVEAFLANCGGCTLGDLYNMVNGKVVYLNNGLYMYKANDK